MSMTETIQAFNDLDYEVLEFTVDYVKIKSMHDYSPSVIQINRNMHNLSRDWIEAHFVDRFTPYMRGAYDPNWTRSEE